MRLPCILYLFGILVTTCCYAQKFTEVIYKNYEVNRALQSDSGMTAILQPYKDSVSRYMNTVIGFSNAAMYKKQPESALGNFMADCLKVFAAKVFKTNVDVAVINYGSLRAHLSKGEITIGAMYELMPYSNQIVIEKVNGTILHQLLDRAAYDGGWPCSGVTMKIKDKEAADIVVNGLPLNDTTTYMLAVTDYLSHGGDGCAMLKNIAQQSKNYLYRDALIDYVKTFTSAGKPVSASLENRVSHVSE